MPPEPSGPDPFVLAAFIVSICSASITLLGLAWQLTLYRLSGARLKVQLVFCYTDDGGHMTWRTAGRGRPAFADVRAGMDGMSDIGIEYGQVRVTNVGRTAVSVESISYAVRHRYRWTLRRHRATIQPWQFLRKDSDLKDLTPDLSNPIRLEPGGHVTAEFYLWPALAGHDHGTREGAISVRGSAHAVGRKWATRSQRRRAWKLPAGATTYFSDVEVTPELRMFRELWSHQHRARLSAWWALLMRREINNRLAEGATSKAIQDYLDQGMERLDDEGKYMGNVLLSFAVHREYHNDPSPPPLGRLQRALYGVTGVPPWRKPSPPR
ncbi:hypothetical protein [Mycobacterium sp. ENV421]|uniref:hypothetical protein n=1 Tax=Mycobacterium sp. ENV421 TaxID=1213407 RepID=UPI00115720D2|nr:hypothetical protein [Mycobacterium sp. ENV421]